MKTESSLSLNFLVQATLYNDFFSRKCRFHDLNGTDMFLCERGFGKIMRIYETRLSSHVLDRDNNWLTDTLAGCPPPRLNRLSYPLALRKVARLVATGGRRDP